ncbi:hypothetical protein K2Q00_02760 [Patescibacteria group bacterium]|nr:hypothetical protein [Patescibacteria group bacterium]
MAIKWGIAVIVVAALAWLLWWSGWLTHKQNNPMTGNQNATSTQEVAPINGMSASSDASDAAIAQDSAAIDAQLSAYTTDASDVDSSMNDKQISQ